MSQGQGDVRVATDPVLVTELFNVFSQLLGDKQPLWGWLTALSTGTQSSNPNHPHALEGFIHILHQCILPSIRSPNPRSLLSHRLPTSSVAASLEPHRGSPFTTVLAQAAGNSHLDRGSHAPLPETGIRPSVYKAHLHPTTLLLKLHQ